MTSLMLLRTLILQSMSRFEVICKDSSWSSTLRMIIHRRNRMISLFPRWIRYVQTLSYHEGILYRIGVDYLHIFHVKKNSLHYCFAHNNLKLSIHEAKITKVTFSNDSTFTFRTDSNSVPMQWNIQWRFRWRSEGSTLRGPTREERKGRLLGTGCTRSEIQDWANLECSHSLSVSSLASPHEHQRLLLRLMFVSNS